MCSSLILTFQLPGVLFETFAHNPLGGSYVTVFPHPSLNSFIQIANNLQWVTWQFRQAWTHKQTLGAWRANTKTPFTYWCRLGAGRHISTGRQQKAMRPGNLLYLLLYLPIIGKLNKTVKCSLKTMLSIVFFVFRDCSGQLKRLFSDQKELLTLRKNIIYIRSISWPPCWNVIRCRKTTTRNTVSDCKNSAQPA